MNIKFRSENLPPGRKLRRKTGIGWPGKKTSQLKQKQEKRTGVG